MQLRKSKKDLYCEQCKKYVYTFISKNILRECGGGILKKRSYMYKKDIMEKGIIVLAGTWISNKFGLLLPSMALLLVLMIMDYISGMLAAKKEALEHKNDKKYGWSSKKSILGIYKKVGYMLTIVVALCMDYLIYKFASEIGVKYNSSTFFGLLVTIWFVINEIISVLENVGRMGTELPDFLKNVLAELKSDINNKK